MLRTASAFLISAVLLAGLGGCGYRLVSYPSHADAGGVAIQNFDNESFDYGYEFVIADALRKEFARRGAFKVVNDPARAQMVINGSIRPIVTNSRSFSSVVSTLEYEVGVVLQVEVARPGDVQLGVDSRVLRERELYLASADIEVTRRNRDEALRRVASTLAERVHDVLYEVAPPPDVATGPAGAAATGSTLPPAAEATPEPLPSLEPLPPQEEAPLPPLPSLDPPRPPPSGAPSE